jgi:predicted GIY-YIG superfamily endonuclease
MNYAFHDAFAKQIEDFPSKLDQLLAVGPYRKGSLPKNIPKSGVYLFSIGDTHLYVGRSDRIRHRCLEHSRSTSAHNSASFAFLLAREKTNNIRAAYKTEGGRKWLVQQPEFKSAFLSAKIEIENMDFRYVEEPDPNRQALLEIYVAITLDAKYNGFKNH